MSKNVKIKMAFKNTEDVLDVILKHIISKCLSIVDFDNLDIINSILTDLVVYGTEEEVLNSEIRNKYKVLSKIPRKRDYIASVGKIICDILEVKNGFFKSF